MATAEQYAQWIVANQDKKGTPEFDTVAQAYKIARGGASQLPPLTAEQPAKTTIGQDIKQGLGNVLAGAARGAGSIGATLLTPLDTAARAVGIENSIIGRKDRREAMDQALSGMGAETDSLGYGAGKLALEVAGTAGAGGALAKGLSALPYVAKAAPSVVDAIRTGSMSAGGLTGAKALGTRVAGGAITGGAAGSMINPNEAGESAFYGGAMPLVGKALGSVGPLARRTFGATTGVGDEALAQAFKAGKAGGETGDAFAKAMRGESSIDDVLTAAKQNVYDMVQQKQSAYRQGMIDIKSDKSILDFGGVDNALNKSMNMVSFKGQAKNPQAAQSLQKVAEEIDAWKQLDPAEFHTPEGLDALKQKIGAVLESIPFEQKTARQAVGDVYNSIKGEITKQAPKYASVMRDYSEASDLIKEVERSLSLGQKASADTAMRKLQSLMRNNVNTSYGYRGQLAQQLESAGGRPIMPALAGQALSEWAPRGLQRAGAAVTGGGLAMTGNIPAAAGLAAISSPRLAGEGAYLMGKGARYVPESLLDRLRLEAYRAAPVIGAQ